MKNKFTLFILFTAVCMSCQSQEIQRIDIKSVDFRIETPFRITCEKFEDFFQEDIDTISIKDQEKIMSFSRIIAELKEVDQSEYPLPDTRVKMEIMYEEKKTIICISHLSISISDKLYITSDAMLEFIADTITSKPETWPKN